MISPGIKPASKRVGMITSKKKRGLVVIFLILILSLFYFLFFINADTTPDHLKGIWHRSDGPYTIEITDIQQKGKLMAKYFNPNPINVGKSYWRAENGKILIYIELRDRNYPGSVYRLIYDDKNNSLNGTYFQAVTKETFEVDFTSGK